MNYVTPPIPGFRFPWDRDPPERIRKLPTNPPLETGECLEDQQLINYGYRKVQPGRADPGNIRAGDIITVFATTLIHEACINIHSGIVIQDGGNVVIRQKPNPDNCVTDFTLDEFLTIYDVRARKAAPNVWRQ
jgi:hypothetical protein